MKLRSLAVTIAGLVMFATSALAQVTTAIHNFFFHLTSS